MSLQIEYDAWHTRYHELNTGYDDTSTPWYMWVAQRMIDVRGLRTLEVACGRGGFVRALARKGADAVGLDFSRAALKIGRERSLNFEEESRAAFVQGDAHLLPFPDGYFDVIVSCETIEHLPQPEKGVGEFHRVTKPGGILFLTTPNYFNLMGLYEFYSKFRHPQLPIFPGRNPVRLRSIDENESLRSLLRIFAYTYCLIAKKRVPAPNLG
jgi:ubiquinone/menaquinone biosynthesis C-methylase UbiE